MTTTHLLIDLDGTISNSHEGIARSLQYAFTETGYEPPTGSLSTTTALALCVFVAVPLLLVDHVGEPALCQPLADAPLPASVYMLVDKTVELQAKPLKDFPELGQLPAGEEERQALMVFANPRQAKRHCGRTQRVIKVPDTRILERTAPYLIAQGISRVVMEGSLYSLPGS